MNEYEMTRTQYSRFKALGKQRIISMYDRMTERKYSSTRSHTARVERIQGGMELALNLIAIDNIIKGLD